MTLHMLPYFFIGCGVVTMISIFLILGRRAQAVQIGAVPELYGEHGGLGEVYMYLYRVYKNIMQAAGLLKKLAFQYIFHILVRVLYYAKASANGAYAFARNQFVKNAVKSKVSVSLFWSHLKEYKKQIEKEQKG